MRRTPRIATLVLAGAILALTVSLGCASRKQVTTTTPEPAPPPPTETAPPPQETTPPPPQEQPKLSLEDAFFDFDDSSLRQDAKSALENDAKVLEQNSNMNVVIEGHCDERGSVEYNLALGEKRARAAKDYLVSYGIPANRLTTISYGKERPFDPGHTEDAWAKNRRAHFVAK